MSFVIEARVDSVGETVHGALLDQRHHKDDEEDEGEEEALRRVRPLLRYCAQLAE